MSADEPRKDEPKTERFNMFLSPSEMKAIDDWAWRNRIRSKSEAVRQLCEAGLLLDKIAPALRDVLEQLEVARDGPEEERKAADFDAGIEALYRALGPVLIGRLGIHTMSDMDIEVRNSRVIELLWKAANEEKP